MTCSFFGAQPPLPDPQVRLQPTSGMRISVPQGSSRPLSDLQLQRQEVVWIAFKPSPFWKTNPDLWFIKYESQVIVAGINSHRIKQNFLLLLQLRMLKYYWELEISFVSRRRLMHTNI
ncbi:hypothetical protein TNCT_498731 [Trichonephila clavata]|uniref:Uncharacterized protein n=1 Tax=Trichonephila clavata TaxID=2740835 RepID=A0A8X6LMA4_TRICU|nr:hypothetical protein TNCT_498731 [Trichonephila clavata]